MFTRRFTVALMGFELQLSGLQLVASTQFVFDNARPISWPSVC